MFVTVVILSMAGTIENGNEMHTNFLLLMNMRSFCLLSLGMRPIYILIQFVLWRAQCAHNMQKNAKITQ